MIFRTKIQQIQKHLLIVNKIYSKMGSIGIKNSDGCKVDILIAKHKAMLIIRPKA